MRHEHNPPVPDRQPPAISPIALAAGREILFEAVMDLADWAASHALSACQCAHRGESECVAAHLEQAANAIQAARMTFASIEAKQGRAAP